MTTFGGSGFHRRCRLASRVQGADGTIGGLTLILPMQTYTQLAQCSPTSPCLVCDCSAANRGPKRTDRSWTCPFLTVIHLCIIRNIVCIFGYSIMAKARIRRPDGTTILINGNPQEVAELIGKLGGGGPSKAQGGKSLKSRGNKSRATLSDLLLILVEEGFFKKPKDLAAVKSALAERGNLSPVTTVAPALLRLVQRRYMRRLKQDKRWFYTG